MAARLRGQTPDDGGKAFPRRSRQADAADSRGGLVEVAADECFIQPDRLENLGTPVALDRADAHLGHHLDDPFLDRFAISVDRLVVVDAGDHPVADHVVERLERDVGVDSAGAIAQEKGEVMNLAGVTAFDDEPGRGPQTPADHLMMQARAGQQRWDRRHLGVTPRSERMIRLAPLLDRVHMPGRSSDSSAAPSPARPWRPRTAWERSPT